jgi:ribosomal protein L11 methylase PrmA
MRIGEKIILLFPKQDKNAGPKGSSLDDSLKLIKKEFPDLLCNLKTKKIIDYGCGVGMQSIALAALGAKYVLGIDNNKDFIKRALELKN